MTSLSLLRGRHILVVENGFFLEDDARQALRAAGASFEAVSASAGKPAFSGEHYDGAILDLELDVETAFSVTEELTRHRVPWIFAVSGAAGPGDSTKPFRLSGRQDDLSAIAEALFRVD